VRTRYTRCTTREVRLAAHRARPNHQTRRALEVRPNLTELIRNEGVIRPDPGPSPEPLSADPDDGYLIDLARDARADALVTGDAHLLELRAIIPTMAPAEFLEMLPGR
jgi:predicted nucleic acid-binding protein